MTGGPGCRRRRCRRRPRGCWLMKSGPGWMPWMVMAPSITAVTASPGIPKAMIVTSEPATLELLEASEAMMPSGMPGAELLRMPGELLGLVVGHHVGRAAADRRQHADQEPDDRGPQQQERPREDLPDHREVGHVEVGGARCRPAAAPRAPIFSRSRHDLGEGEDADEHGQELEAVPRGSRCRT